MGTRVIFFCCFFFQAEDGIRDVAVTGVQTCALPILLQKISEGYFRVLRIPFKTGRAFSEAEINDLRKLAVVNETFASTYFRGEDPIGHRVKLGALETLADTAREPWFEIVGVVADATNNEIGRASWRERVEIVGVAGMLKI